MQRKIESSDVDAILLYLRRKKSSGGSETDTVYYTDQGKEKPVNILESARISNVQFYDATGNAVVSSTPDEKVAAAVISTAYGQCVWVKPDHEALLATDQFSSLMRIRAIE